MTSSNFLFKRETSNVVDIQNFYFLILFSVRYIEGKIAVGGVSFVRIASLECHKSELERPSQFSAYSI